jgi:parathyroid hormone receptor 1
LFKFRKLRCPRNTLHMHLFASFILRASMGLLKDSLFVEGVGFSSDVVVKGGETYFSQQEVSAT